MSASIKVADRDLAYTKVGQGPAVLIVHGIGGHKEDWAAFADTLGRTHMVYAIDMLGFDASSKTGSIITIADQVAAMVALLDAERIVKADLIGNSVGGWVTATFAADHPDRVKKLVLIDAAGFRAMFQGPPPVDFYPRDAEAMTNLLEHVRFDPSAHTPGYAETALRASLASGDGQAAEAVGKGMFASPRLEDVADRILAPTLIVWGADDRLFPPAIADLVAAHIERSQKALIHQASHFPQLNNPTAFNAAVLPFLAE